MIVLSGRFPRVFIIVWSYPWERVWSPDRMGPVSMKRSRAKIYDNAWSRRDWCSQQDTNTALEQIRFRSRLRNHGLKTIGSLINIGHDRSIPSEHRKTWTGNVACRWQDAWLTASKQVYFPIGSIDRNLSETDMSNENGGHVVKYVIVDAYPYWYRYIKCLL